MDQLNEPPGWRTELRWGVATLAALALCAAIAPLLPVVWIAGRWWHGADR